MDDILLVSICSTTYNREDYIAQAIESWLKQKVTFDYEIIISDDCSTDKTTKIIEEFIANNPKIKFKLLYAEKNLGFNLNSVKAYKAAKGKYIAQCDSDDYWIDDYKLQKQIEFLESHPDFVMCLTNTIIVDDSSNESKPAKIRIWDQCSTYEIITQHNSIEAQKIGEINTLGHMSSLVFRNNIILEFPEWYATTYNNDDTLFVMLSKFGKAKFINDFSTVYRNNPSGVSSKNFTFENDYYGRIVYYKHLKKYLLGKFNNEINQLLSIYNLKLSKIFNQQKKTCLSIKHFILFIYYKPSLIIKKAFLKSFKLIVEKWKF